MTIGTSRDGCRPDRAPDRRRPSPRFSTRNGAARRPNAPGQGPSGGAVSCYGRSRQPRGAAHRTLGGAWPQRFLAVGRPVTQVTSRHDQQEPPRRDGQADQHHGARADDAPSQQPLGSGQWLSSRTRFHRSSGSVHPGSRGATDVGARFVLRDEALVVAGCTTSQGLPAVRRPEPDSLDGTSRSETCSISASSIILLGPSSRLQTAESFHHERWGDPPTVV